MRVTLLSVFFFILGISVPFSISAQSSYYQTTNAGISFFSSAPVEDIEAISKSGISVLNSKNGSVSFKVKVRSFEFEKGLMQEHFNENYMESEEYPDASLKGNFVEMIDFNDTEVQKLMLRGTLNIHGVSKEREIPVMLRVSKDKETIMLKSEFDVLCKDHKIKIPKLLWENIAEVIMVNVNLEYKIIKE
ncbi:YceI family protein [Christiangramia forsetii]|nr:YceI family protein [Christiangramia forsetii]